MLKKLTRVNSFIRKKQYLLLSLTVLFVLIQTGVVLAADSTADVSIPSTASLTSLGGAVNIVVNFFRYIGGTVLLAFGYYHTFSVSAHAKNASKRAVAIEGLMWTGIAVLIFFMAPYLIGVLRGVGTSVTGASQ